MFRGVYAAFPRHHVNIIERGSRQIHPKTRSYRRDRCIRNIEREYPRPPLISSGWLMEVAALRCDEGEIASTSHKTDRERAIVYRKSRIDTSMPQIEASGNNTVAPIAVPVFNCSPDRRLIADCILAKWRIEINILPRIEKKRDEKESNQ